MADESIMKDEFDSNRAQARQATKFAAGKGMEAGGKGAQMAGKAVGGIGKKLTATKYGAVLGVPLQFAGKGMEAGGKGAQMAGKQISKKGAGQKQGLTEAMGKLMQPGGAGGAGISPTELLKSGGASKQIQLLSAEALKQSWLNIIDSWGLTFIYIIFHFIGYYLGGPLAQFFCRPGEEGAFGLIPKKYQAIVQAAGKTSIGETIDAGSEYAELVVFLSLCFLLLIIILLVLALMGAVLQVLKLF